MNKPLTNYQSALARLSRANTPEDYAKLDASLDRCYNAGVLTVSEYERLTVKLMMKQCQPYGHTQ